MVIYIMEVRRILPSAILRFVASHMDIEKHSLIGHFSKIMPHLIGTFFDFRSSSIGMFSDILLAS
jgi:hypothetical protein